MNGNLPLLLDRVKIQIQRALTRKVPDELITLCHPYCIIYIRVLNHIHHIDHTSPLQVIREVLLSLLPYYLKLYRPDIRRLALVAFLSGDPVCPGLLCIYYDIGFVVLN